MLVVGQAKITAISLKVPADANGLVDPVPLKEMGRFNHEAAQWILAQGLCI